MGVCLLVGMEGKGKTMIEYWIDVRIEKLRNGDLRVFRVYDEEQNLLIERVVGKFEDGDKLIDVCVTPNDAGFPEVYPKSYINYLQASFGGNNENG